MKGDVLLSSGCIAYLGAFTSHYREQTTDKWVTLSQDAGRGLHSVPFHLNLSISRTHS